MKFVYNCKGERMSRAKTYNINKKIVDEIREANLLTQEDVANMICESQQTIAKYKWTASTIENFCKVFKCEPCEIVLSDENEMRKDFPHLYNWLVNYREECKKETLEDNGINHLLIEYIKSQGYSVDFLDFDKTTVLSEAQLRSFGTMIPYIRIYNQESSIIYTLNEFTKKEAKINSFLLPN